MPPKVSVVMSAYNAMEHLEDAVASVLSQTFRDFEFLIVDDGSSDNTPEMLVRFSRNDARVRVLSQQNAGLTLSLIRAVNEARGEFVARIDADDLWLPGKLAMQVAYLEQHSDVGLLGTAYSLADECGNVTGGQDVPLVTGHSAVYDSLLRFNPFLHSSVMFRKSLVDQCGSYDPAYATAQDYELWTRMLRVTQGDNLPDVLAYRRISDGMISCRRERLQRLTALKIKCRERLRRKTLGGILTLCKDLAVVCLPRPVLAALRGRA